MTFSLTVLGCGSPYPTPDAACSGYLLRAGSGTDSVEVWVDAGPGTLVNLQRHTRLDRLAAIWLSHLHVDHCSDLLPTYYALAHFGQAPPRPIPVFGPPQWATRMADFLTNAQRPDMRAVLEVHELADGHRAAFGDLELHAVAVEHGIPAFGLRATADGATLAYSGDSRPCVGLDEVARGADLFLCESGRPNPGDLGSQWHCRPEEAAQTAQRAGAKRLVVTHRHPSLTVEDVRRRAASVLGHDVAITSDGDEYRLA